MMRAAGAAEVAPTTYAWEIKAEGLKVKVGKRKLAVNGVDLELGTGVHGLLGPKRGREDHADPGTGDGAPAGGRRAGAAR